MGVPRMSFPEEHGPDGHATGWIRISSKASSSTRWRRLRRAAGASQLQLDLSPVDEALELAPAAPELFAAHPQMCAANEEPRAGLAARVEMDDGELCVGGEVRRLDRRVVRRAGDGERAQVAEVEGVGAHAVVLPVEPGGGRAAEVAAARVGHVGGIAGEKEMGEDGLSADAAGEFGDPWRAARVGDAVDVIEICVTERAPAGFGFCAGDDEAGSFAGEGAERRAVLRRRWRDLDVAFEMEILRVLVRCEVRAGGHQVDEHEPEAN